MAIEIFQRIQTEFEEPILNFVTEGVSNLADAINGPMRVAVMLYIVLYGFLILRGMVQAPMMDMVWRCVKIVIIVQLVTKVDVYNQYVTTLFFETIPHEVGTALAGGARINSRPRLRPLTFSWPLWSTR